GRAYANLHTVAHPGGEIRGQIRITDRRPVSHYSDPEFSWRYEVAPAGIGFINSTALGRQYFGDMIVGAARDFLQGGTLFRFNLTSAKPGHGNDHRGWGNGKDDDDDGHGGKGNDNFNHGRLHGRTLAFEDPRL